MSDDPIKDLQDFNHQGLTVNPLPASEVRRRGDRMRRRNHTFAAVGAAAAVALIVTPLAFLTNGGDHAEPVPTNPSVTTSQTPTHRIPDDFRLEITYPPTNEDGTPVETTGEPGVGTIKTCGKEIWSPTGAPEVAGASYSGIEDFRSRTLAVYGSDAGADAHSAMVMAKFAFGSCSSETRLGTESVYDRVEFEEGDESFAFTQRYRGDTGFDTGLTIYQFVRVGDAVLVTTTYGEAGSAQGISDAVAQASKDTQFVVDQMSVFGEAPPNDPLDAYWLPLAPESEKVGQGDVPDLPLRDGLPDLTGDGGELLGPAADIEGVDRRLVCGNQILDPGNLPTGRLVASSSGPEYGEVRQVVAYADADAAVRQLTYLRQLFEACPTEDAVTDTMGWNTMYWDVFETQPGYDTVAVGQAYDQGLGGQVYQFTRVGRAILALSRSGEMSRSGLRSAVEPLDQTSRELAPLLCSFTEAGC